MRLNPLNILLSTIWIFSSLLASNVKFDLVAQPSHAVSKKCLTMWMAKDSHVTCEISAQNKQGQTVSFEIFDLSQFYNKYASKNGASATEKIVFTPSESTDIHFCFWNTLENGIAPNGELFTPVGLNVQIGKSEEEYNKLAKAEKLKPQELELLRLEERFNLLVSNMEHFKTKDFAKLATHEQTKRSIASFSFFSIGVLVVVGIWQILYLRHYFKAKRLI